MKKLLLLLLLSLGFIGSANADSTDALVDKTYSITKKDGSAFCLYTIDILATEELLEQKFHTVNLDFDLTQNDGFILQTYWSPDSKRTWLPIPTESKMMLGFSNTTKHFHLSISRNTISLPIERAWKKTSWSGAFLEADGSSWIRIVLFTPQSC
jgi:hypothetical protein